MEKCKDCTSEFTCFLENACLNERANNHSSKRNTITQKKTEEELKKELAEANIKIEEQEKRIFDLCKQISLAIKREEKGAILFAEWISKNDWHFIEAGKNKWRKHLYNDNHGQHLKWQTTWQLLILFVREYNAVIISEA